jgi:hypothetical protein
VKPGAATLDRRTFIGAVAVLAGCTHSLIRQTKIAESFVLDPDWTTYRPILRDLIRIILPLDDPHFPKLTLDEIETRLISMFPLENEQRFLGLQRTLTLFEQVDLFPIVSSPLLLEEEKARDGARPDLASDERAYREFAGAHAIRGAAQFTKLPAGAQRAYFLLWHDSAFIVKRAFHSGMKTLVMITVYSADAMWPTIGYAGPLV